MRKETSNIFFGKSVCTANWSMNTIRTKSHFLCVMIFFLLFLADLDDVFGAKQLRIRGFAETRYTRLQGGGLTSLCEKETTGVLKQMCDQNDDNILYNRIRPSIRVKFSRKVKMRVTGNFQTNHFRLYRKVNSIHDLFTLDRLYLDLRTKYVDIRAGKQAFQWGPAQLWSLTIPFNPQDATDFSPVLPGLWAITANIPIGETGGLRLGVMATPDLQNAIEFIRWSQTFGTTEVGLVVMEHGALERVTIGVEAKGQLGVALWFEGAVHIPYTETDKDGKERKTEVGVVVGMDYSFPVMEGLIFAMQYYFNSPGFTDKADYPFNSTEGLIKMFAQNQNQGQQQAVTGVGLSSGGFMAQHYLMLTGNLSINEDLGVSVLALMNLVDFSVMTGPSVRWTFLDDFSLSVGGYFFLGPEGSEYAPGKLKLPIAGVPDEGVALIPSIVLFTWLRYNF